MIKAKLEVHLLLEFSEVCFQQLVRDFPLMKYIWTNLENTVLTVSKFIRSFEVKFSTEGSSDRVKEEHSYQTFINYVREIAGIYYFEFILLQLPVPFVLAMVSGHMIEKHNVEKNTRSNKTRDRKNRRQSFLVSFLPFGAFRSLTKIHLQCNTEIHDVLTTIIVLMKEFVNYF